MKKILAILVSFIVLAAPVFGAVETVETKPIEPGITPDSWMYGLDKAMEKVQLTFTFNEVKRAELRYKFAEERLGEVREMINQGKPEFVEGLMENHNRQITQARGEIVEAIATGQDITRLQKATQLNKLLLEDIEQVIPHEIIIEAKQNSEMTESFVRENKTDIYPIRKR